MATRKREPGRRNRCSTGLSLTASGRVPMTHAICIKRAVEAAATASYGAARSQASRREARREVDCRARITRAVLTLGSPVPLVNAGAAQCRILAPCSAKWLPDEVAVEPGIVSGCASIVRRSSAAEAVVDGRAGGRLANAWASALGISLAGLVEGTPAQRHRCVTHARTISPRRRRRYSSSASRMIFTAGSGPSRSSTMTCLCSSAL